MKEEYIKPEVQIIEMELEGVIASSGDPGATAPDMGWDDSWTGNTGIW